MRGVSTVSFALPNITKKPRTRIRTVPAEQTICMQVLKLFFPYRRNNMPMNTAPAFAETPKSMFSVGIFNLQSPVSAIAPKGIVQRM